MKSDQKKWLKGQAHSLKPVVIIGAKGLTEGVHQEIERALEDHELIKIRISHKESDYRKEIRDQIISKHAAELIGAIGHVIIVYRKNPE